MEISSDAIIGLLARRLSFKRLGNPVDLGGIPLPKLATQKAIPRGRVFVVDARDVPPGIPENSLVACVGGTPDADTLPRRCDVICIDDEDATCGTVLNALQDSVEALASWLMDISELAANGSDVRAMLERSIPIFENSMTITDYELRVLAHCLYDRTTEPPAIRMDNTYPRVPEDMTRHYIGLISGNMIRHEPFFFDDPTGHNYCVNLFDGDTYIGCCSLANWVHEIQDFETQLFRVFASYVRRALIAQGGTPREQILTMTSVFSRLVQREQVPRSQVDRAYELLRRSTREPVEGRLWCCVVIRNANQGKDMPESYVITSVERLVPSSHAFFHEGNLVMFALLLPSEDDTLRIRRRLEPFLRDMNFRAGASRSFADVFSTFSHYRQAVCALQGGMAKDDGQVAWAFDDLAFDYMLEQSMGEFNVEDIIAPELMRLASLGPGGIGLEYIDTLRAYLDNNCNGLQTSKATYLHRSTLAQRIDRIREVVNLDSAERRLYLQMCLHLPSVRWNELSQRG